MFLVPITRTDPAAEDRSLTAKKLTGQHKKGAGHPTPCEAKEDNAVPKMAIRSTRVNPSGIVSTVVVINTKQGTSLLTKLGKADAVRILSSDFLFFYYYSRIP